MAASYPGAAKTFTAKADGPGNTVAAAHMNAVQDEIAALEAALLTSGLAHVLPVNAGVKFPATQAASADVNVLDDYEEGAWTPTDASGAGLTITNNGCKYIKVGKLVTIFGYLTYPATADGTAAKIGGLPFTSDAGTYGGFAVHWSEEAALALMVTAGATTVELITSGATTAKTNANLTTNAFRFSGQYMAAA